MKYLEMELNKMAAVGRDAPSKIGCGMASRKIHLLLFVTVSKLQGHCLPTPHLPLSILGRWAEYKQSDYNLKN